MIQAARRTGGYVGRFAPSPTGPLHAGSLVAALASRLDALVHGGRWLLRIEDVDTPRTVAGAADDIMRTLATLGFSWDGQPLFQSARASAYEAAFERLRAAQHVYPCACTRREIADSLLRAGEALARHGELVYRGTCRSGLPAGRASRAWRLRVPPGSVEFFDRCAGPVHQDVEHEVGDFVLRRADGVWAYQLAVVVDDDAQCVTDVVRGADLLASTPRQIVLQRLLGMRTPRYLHVPLVTDERGEKLSKQTAAQSVDAARPLDALQRAAAHLGLDSIQAASLDAFWQEAARRWGARCD